MIILDFESCFDQDRPRLLYLMDNEEWKGSHGGHGVADGRKSEIGTPDLRTMNREPERRTVNVLAQGSSSRILWAKTS